MGYRVAGGSAALSTDSRRMEVGLRSLEPGLVDAEVPRG